MKHLLKSITNSSTLLDGYSYDRATFRAGHVWTRSLTAGAISTSLTAIGIYCGSLAMDPQFAAGLGAQSLNFKLAAGAVITSLLGYSLRDLARSVIQDVKTQMRVARANSWLMKGTVSAHDYKNYIHMQQTALTMVRFVEVEGGIKLYAIAKHPEQESSILIDVMLFDEEYPALATYFTHESDIRSSLNVACGEWSETVANILGIQLSQAANLRNAHAEATDDVPFTLDDEFLDELSGDVNPVFARASAPRPRGEVLRAAAVVPPETITH